MSDTIDLWHSVTKFFDHERGKVLGLLLGISAAIGPTACESRTADPWGSGEQVTRAELTLSARTEREAIEAERYALEAQRAALERRITTYNESLDQAEGELDAADLQKQQWLEFVGGALGTVASGGSLNLVSLLTSALTLGGAGLFGGHALIDSRRKNARIEAAKKGTP